MKAPSVKRMGWPFTVMAAGASMPGMAPEQCTASSSDMPEVVDPGKLWISCGDQGRVSSPISNEATMILRSSSLSGLPSTPGTGSGTLENSLERRPSPNIGLSGLFWPSSAMMVDMPGS